MPEEKNNKIEKNVPKKPVAPNTQKAKGPVSSNKAAAGAAAKSVYGQKRAVKGNRKFKRAERQKDEFEQRIVDLARVTRVMAGGKRMRFRACIVIGDRKGRIGLGMDKGADVPQAVNKAVTKAKKNIIDVPIVNDTVPYSVFHKKGAAKILIKPARKGKGVIAGGAARIVFELAGLKNITAKILGTNNNVNVAKCTLEALDGMKKVEKPKRIVKKVFAKKPQEKNITKK